MFPGFLQGGPSMTDRDVDPGAKSANIDFKGNHRSSAVGGNLAA